MELVGNVLRILLMEKCNWNLKVLQFTIQKPFTTAVGYAELYRTLHDSFDILIFIMLPVSYLKYYSFEPVF